LQPPLAAEFGVPLRTCNLALAEMTEALNRGWEGWDSRSVMLLQEERAGVQIAWISSALNRPQKPRSQPGRCPKNNERGRRRP
jgi:hypothetical protein